MENDLVSAPIGKPSDTPPPIEEPGTPRRLHPLSPLFGLTGMLRQFAIPILVFVVFARGDGGWQWWIWVSFTGLLIAELFRFFTLTYRFTPRELVIRHGLLSRTERQIPYERVQNVELVQNALHRLVGVAEVKLQTGAGAELDAHLRVISLDAVDELRRAVLSRKSESGADAAGSAPTVVLRLPLKEVLLHGLITGRGLIVLAAAMGLLFEFDLDLDQYFQRWLPEAPVLWEQAMGFSGATFLKWGLAFSFALLVLRLLAAIWAMVRLYDFTLERTGDGLQSRYGLLTRVTATIPRARVQTITVQEGVWHRWLRRSAVRAETAGGFAQQQNRLGSQWVAPIVRREALLPVVREVQPDAELDPDGWQGVHPRARTRIVRRQIVVFGLIALSLAATIGTPAVIATALLAALAVWHAHVLTARLAVALTPTSIVTRSGAWAHRRSIARFARIQSVTCTRTPFDRRWRMATLSVDTAGGSSEHRIVVPYLPEDRAEAIYARLRAEVARALRAADDRGAIGVP